MQQRVIEMLSEPDGMQALEIPILDCLDSIRVLSSPNFSAMSAADSSIKRRYSGMKLDRPPQVRAAPGTAAHMRFSRSCSTGRRTFEQRRGDLLPLADLVKAPDSISPVGYRAYTSRGGQAVARCLAWRDSD